MTDENNKIWQKKMCNIESESNIHIIFLQQSLIDKITTPFKPVATLKGKYGQLFGRFQTSGYLHVMVSFLQFCRKRKKKAITDNAEKSHGSSFYEFSPILECEPIQALIYGWLIIWAGGHFGELSWARSTPCHPDPQQLTKTP